MWFNHLRYNTEQNKRNLIVKGSLKKMLKECHPQVFSTEVDISDYNPDAKSFKDIAYQWKIDTDYLSEGPMIMVMHQQTGEILWATKGTSVETFLQRIDAELRQVEQSYFGKSGSMCKIELDYSEIDNFEKSDPWGKLRSAPGAPKKKKPAPVKKEAPAPAPVSKPEPTPEPTPTPVKKPKKFTLNEPEKAFRRRRR